MACGSATNKHKVLVLSHLFPNERLANLGCFVAEQVKSLKESQGVDVRVVSGYPYWCNLRNPCRFIYSLLLYFLALYRVSWKNCNEIPVLYVPYLVGHPFFPFMFQSFTYRFAIQYIVRKRCKQFSFDIVHAHTGYLDGSTGAELAREYGVPLVITEHTGPFSVLMKNPLVRRITLKALASADRLIAVSPALAGEMKKWIHPSVSDNIISLPNGVDTEMFFPVSKKDERSEGLLKLLSVISLEEIKNPFLLLQAAENLTRKGKRIQVKIAGDGPLRGAMEEWVKERGLNQEIILLGGQPREEIARLMRKECDIFVLTSQAETFGVVVIEALASGKPVVSTRCGGPESVITQPHLGALCANGDPDVLVSAIETVSDRLDTYGSAEIRKHAIENYCYSVLANRLAEIYDDLSRKNL